MMAAMRARIVISALGLTLAAWSIDWIAAAAPQSAEAAGAPEGPAVFPASQSAVDVDSLIAALQRSPADSSEILRRFPLRNLFAVDGPFATLATGITARSGGNSAVAPAPPPPPEAPFEQRHTLQAVVTGPITLALIDDTLVSVGATVDGRRVREILRDRVILEDESGEIVLRLASAP